MKSLNKRISVKEFVLLNFIKEILGSRNKIYIKKEKYEYKMC